ncbi:MAG: hypothetical protein M0T72_10380, partial [Candidatus Dormibacteraeota bacterium]|nr:hypothetical protein [Candidatus Dormibacteraeota bacterium]
GPLPLDTIGLSVNPAAITVTVTSSVANAVYVSAFVASGSAGGGMSIASYDTTVLTKLSLAPVAYWKLTEPAGSTSAADSSGNGYTLTANGTVTFGEPSVVPSDPETCVQGDGTTGYLVTSGTPALVPTGASPVSVIAAINMPTATPERSVASWGAATANNLWQFEGYNYNFFFGDFGTALQAAVPVVHQPTLVGFSYDGKTFLGFVNGQVGWRQSNLTIAITPAPVYVMALTGPSRFSNFPIGRVAIFAGVLAPKDWRLLMQAFTGV